MSFTIATESTQANWIAQYMRWAYGYFAHPCAPRGQIVSANASCARYWLPSAERLFAYFRLLRNRSLIKVTKASPTAVPQYELIRHWLRRRMKKS